MTNNRARGKRKIIIAGEVYDHVHLYDLPKKMIRSGTVLNDHKEEVLKMMQALTYNFEKVAYSANKCLFMLDSITNTSPHSPDERDVFNSIADFVYNYENYSMRVYIFREKVALLLNAVINPSWPKDKKVDLDLFLHSTEFKQSKFDSVIKKFEYTDSINNPVGTLIKDRNELTHKLYFAGKDHYMRPEYNVNEDASKAEMKDWFKDWRKNIKEKEELTSRAHESIIDIHHKLAEKVYFKLQK